MWRDVMIPGDVVASGGFEAHVGGPVSMALELGCTWRGTVPGSPTSSATRVAGGPGQRGGYDVVGRVVPVDEGSWPHGWVLDVGGLAVYVTELGAGTGPAGAGPRREPGSEPALPLPAAGTWVRVRGPVAIAEDHVVDGFAPRAALLQRATRQWTVQRIVRLHSRTGASRAEEVDAVGPGHAGRGATAYLLDLADGA